MSLRYAVLLTALLGGNLAFAASGGMSLKSMQPGQSFTIQTEDRYYRGQLVDRETGETLMAGSWDGQRFSAPRKVYLLGATAGRLPEGGGLMLVSMHQVKPGMRLELGMGSLAERDRRVTSRVVSIAVGK